MKFALKLFCLPYTIGRFSFLVWSFVRRDFLFLRPTLMHTKNLYKNEPNPFFSGFFNLMGTRMVQICMAKSV